MCESHDLPYDENVECAVCLRVVGMVQDDRAGNRACPACLRRCVERPEALRRVGRGRLKLMKLFEEIRASVSVVVATFAVKRYRGYANSSSLEGYC
jgi:hypothetical protein